MKKAIVPVAGIGKRLKPHTYSLPKVLINVAGKPILAYILDELKKIDIKNLVLIIGYMGEKVKEFVERNYNFNTTYIEQEERLGLGHAIYLAKDYFNNDELLIILGDTIFKADLKPILTSKYSKIAVKEVQDPERFGVVTITPQKFVKQLIEKQKHPPSNLAIVGIYYIRESKMLTEALEYIIRNNIKTAGEYQLTDALSYMVRKGIKLRIFNVEEWYDCGKKETLLSTNRELLKMNSRSYNIKGSIVLSPVYISKTTHIENSIIGPFTSIADNCYIKNSIIKDSIVNEYANVENVLLTESIIGSNSKIIGNFDRINLGDSSEIDLT